MKIESLKMNLQSLKSQVNNKKGRLFSEKITKSPTIFRKNKPNSPIVQMSLTFFITMNYTIFASLTKVKNKPNQTQFKPNTKPIVEGPKINLNIYHTKIYNVFYAYRIIKTNPIQTQSQKVCPGQHLLISTCTDKDYNVRLKVKSGLTYGLLSLEPVGRINLFISTYFLED